MVLVVQADASNIYVVQAVETGLLGAFILSSRTPKDVQQWVKSKHNDFHAGSSTSFLELIDMTQDVEASWASYRTLNSITVDSCPKKGPHRYEAQHMKYISTKHKDYKCYDHYRSCRSLRKSMAMFGDMYTPWKELNILIKDNTYKIIDNNNK